MSASGGDPIAAGLVARHGFTPLEAKRAAASVFDVLKAELLAGNNVVVKDFAAVKLVEKKAEIVKDPQTGHQYVRPAENAVRFTPEGTFQKGIERAKLSSIVLAVPAADTFAKVV